MFKQDGKKFIKELQKYNSDFVIVKLDFPFKIKNSGIVESNQILSAIFRNLKINLSNAVHIVNNFNMM